MKNRLFISLILAIISTSPMLAMEPIDNSQAPQHKHQKYIYNLPNQHELNESIFQGINREASPLWLKSMLDKKADPNCRTPNTGMTPLMLAAFMGDKELCNLLIQYGANIYSQDNFGYTALMIRRAAECPILSQEEKICKLLVDEAAKKVKKQKTICLLHCLKKLKKEGNKIAGTLYKESKDLLQPHFHHAYCKPLDLLCMRNEEGQSAFDLLPFPFLDPEEKNTSPIAQLACGPNQRIALMCRLAFQEIDEKQGMYYFRTFFRN